MPTFPPVPQNPCRGWASDFSAYYTFWYCDDTAYMHVCFLRLTPFCQAIINTYISAGDTNIKQIFDFWGTGEEAKLFQGSKDTVGEQAREHKKTNFQYGGTGEQATLFRGTKELVPTPPLGVCCLVPRVLSRYPARSV